MIKPNCCIYLVPFYPHFNPDQVPGFGSFTQHDSVHLYTTLYLNLKEITDTLNSASRIICFDEQDKGFIPRELSLPEVRHFYYNSSLKTSLIKFLEEKFFNDYKINLIIFTNSVISPSELGKALEMLSMDENTVVLGKSRNERMAFIGFNTDNYRAFREIDFSETGFKDILNSICRFDFFVQVLNEPLTIYNREDFRNLYELLSAKENWSFCSQPVHEKFTHLFIEYKELLK